MTWSYGGTSGNEHFNSEPWRGVFVEMILKFWPAPAVPPKIETYLEPPPLTLLLCLVGW